MTEKNNLENLFQEKLASHEVNPPEIVWANLEEKLLEKKKKRRIVPFWWKLSGVAALFVVGFFITNTVIKDNGIRIENNSNDTNQNSIVNSNKENKPTQTNSATKNNSVDVNLNNTETTNKPIINSTNAVVNNSLNVEENKIEKNIQLFKTKTNSNYISKDVSDLKLKNESHNNVPLNIDNQNNTVSNHSITNDKTTETKNNLIKTDKIAMNQDEKVVTKGEENKKIDSAVVASVEPNAMEELLNEKEKKKTKEQKLNRWQVTPYLAPVFFGSLQNGSPLDASLANNTKTFETSMSYGMNVNYNVSKKVSVRTGLNVLDLSYNTQEIVFYQDINARMMKNIAPNSRGEFIQIKPLANVSTELNRVTSERFDGVLNQQMGYIEVPVEFTYKLLNKKIGIEFIGGLSTLFLNKNDIYLTSDNVRMKIGTASNLNNLNFSSNLGLGIKYNLFKNLDTRIEPIFKYQFNTFSQDSGNFRPYIFGVYSGISYKF